MGNFSSPDDYEADHDQLIYEINKEHEQVNLGRIIELIDHSKIDITKPDKNGIVAAEQIVLCPSINISDKVKLIRACSTTPKISALFLKLMINKLTDRTISNELFALYLQNISDLNIEH